MVVDILTRISILRRRKVSLLYLFRRAALLA